MTLNEVIEKLKTAHAAAQLKHGPWDDLPHSEQMAAIREEYIELYMAYIEGNADGDHGEIAEAIDLMVVCARRVMHLTGEVGA